MAVKGILSYATRRREAADTVSIAALVISLLGCPCVGGVLMVAASRWASMPIQTVFPVLYSCAAVSAGLAVAGGAMAARRGRRWPRTAISALVLSAHWVVLTGAWQAFDGVKFGPGD